MFFSSSCDQQTSNKIGLSLLNAEIENTKKSSRSSTIKPNKQLPEKAIRLMNAWYIANEDNPYPNRNDLDYLATNGGIKESQVKAWFSNKRNRTQNTHPKRAKRYLIRNQTQQNPFITQNEPEKLHIADEIEQRVQVFTQNSTNLSSLQSSSSAPSCPNWSWIPTHSYDYYPYHYYCNQ